MVADAVVNSIHPQASAVPIVAARAVPTKERTRKRESTNQVTRLNSPNDSGRPDNFYKINWRVLGGGVRMSGGKKLPSIH